MNIQVITTCNYQGGSVQHALNLAKAISSLNIPSRFVDLTSPTPLSIKKYLLSEKIELLENCNQIPNADVNIIVDLYPLECRKAALNLLEGNSKVILAPTGYITEKPFQSLPRNPDCIWFVSWDQAIKSRYLWANMSNIKVINCCVDTNRFFPKKKNSLGKPWVLSRHSRDVLEKFSYETISIFDEIENSHDVIYRMLGALETIDKIGIHKNSKIFAYNQGTLDTINFLQESDIWLFAHADYWEETACIAALEAMSCGIPIIANNAGGMREYVYHGKTGFLCNSKEEFIRYTNLLLDTPFLYNSMATEARKHVEKNFSFEILKNRIALEISNITTQKNC
ncbi:MAG: glycosyltransferase [Bacteroidales bacterium]|nr:MAG: glycosyltransferase [Bacteroidales bacterium]